MSEFMLTKKLYDSWMKTNGQYQFSRGESSAALFNQDLFNIMMSDTRQYDLNEPMALIQMEAYQDLKIRELFQTFFYEDPQVRNEYGIVGDADILKQTLDNIGTVLERVEKLIKRQET